MSVLTKPTTVRAISALVALMLAPVAAPARAEGPGPAYLVEPGEQPPNSVQMIDPNAAPASAPEATPEETATEDEGVYDSGYDVAPPQGSSVADNDPRAMSEFSPRLDPYGSWTSDPNYGKVWVPDSSVVGDGFSPYLTDGHWEQDASGSQTWMSDYPFGDVVFHYGRWVWISAGWAWIPGYLYAPAWVAWRIPTDGFGYYGWAPLPPSFVWVNQTPVGLPWRSSYYWVFCPSTFVHSPTPSSYVVRSPADAQTVAQHTRAYVPASPRRTQSAPPGAMAHASPPQQWAAGYRPLVRAQTRATAAPATMNGAVAPHVAAAMVGPRPVVVRQPPGAAVMHAATPMRVPVAAPHVVNANAPHVVNAGAPVRTYPAAFRGGVRR
jgi:hypothetical protein